uniref:glucuronosyltransferase n=1 Tax=Panagrolaimus davidi TaxID=227884 RepID=A0A914QDV5_9BILA
MISNGRIADSLALAGHDVTLLNVETIIPMSAFETTKYAKIVTIGTISNITAESGKNVRKGMDETLYAETGLFHSYTSFTGIIEVLKFMMKKPFAEGKETIEKLKAEKFDAIFVEQLFPQGNALGHLLGIDVHFMISSCPMQEHITALFGIPNPTGWVPSIGKLEISDKMTFFERAQNELEHIFLDASYKRFYAVTTEIFQSLYGPSFPDVKDIIREKTPLMFVAVDEFIDFPRPILHNIIYIEVLE